MINNRQAGRRRGRGGNGNGSGGGNGPRQNGQGRSDSGNRIDNRARGNASQLYEKYKNMASDAQRQGDRVNTEYYWQFADHYFRVLSDQRGRFEEQQPRRPSFDQDADEDFGDEGEPIRVGEQGEARRQERQAEERNAQERGQDRQQDRQPREPRGERPRRWEREPRRADGGEEGTIEVAGQHRADPIGRDEDLAARAGSVIAADGPIDPPAEPTPRRRGRPRREASVAIEAPLVPANGFEADRLPPSLGIAAANDAEDGEAPKPRRRRARAVTEIAAD